MSTAEEEAAAKAAAEEDNKPITRAEMRTLMGGKDVSTTAHQAASTHAKRIEEKFAKALADSAAAHQAEIVILKEEWDAKLAGAKPTTKAPDAAAGTPGQGPAGSAPQFKLEEHPDFLAMRKQAETQAKELERLKGKQAEEQKKAAEAVARERKTKLRSTTEELLSKHVAQGRAAHARTFLTHPDNNRVDFESDDSDNIVFINDDGDKVPLEKGLKVWLKSEDAKHYLPPLNPGGSGGGPGRLGSGAPNNIEDEITAIHAKNARGG